MFVNVLTSTTKKMQFSEIAEHYRQACKRVKAAIKASPYKAQWFQQQLGFAGKPDIYYRRLNAGTWTPDQLTKIGLLLEGKEVITD